MLKKRGPDSFKSESIKIDSRNFVCTFAASVLSLRGNYTSQITVQPIIGSRSGNRLLWNGEIFASELVHVGEHENDASALFERLDECKGDESEIFRLIESIQGPYAFVYYVAESGMVYFGRDKLGRRSLLVSCQPKQEQQLILSSVKVLRRRLGGGDEEAESTKLIEFQELKANGVYKINVKGRINQINI